MSDFTKAFYDRLNDDTALTDLLSTYNDLAAIFTSDLVPIKAEMPYIWISGDITGTAFDTKTTRGREIMRDVHCYVAKESSVVKLEQIAERVRTLLHRHKISISNNTAVVMEASTPIMAPTEDGVMGRVVSIRLIAMED